MTNEFVYMQVLNGALKSGATQNMATNEAVQALTKYKKGQFKRAVELIEFHIKQAVKLSKKVKK
jgi:hypothetical protein